MKKKLNRLLCILTSSLLLASAAGCGGEAVSSSAGTGASAVPEISAEEAPAIPSAAELAQKVIDQSESIESSSQTMQLDFQSTITIDGQTGVIALYGGGSNENILSPMTSHMRFLLTTETTASYGASTTGSTEEGSDEASAESSQPQVPSQDQGGEASSSDSSQGSSDELPAPAGSSMAQDEEPGFQKMEMEVEAFVEEDGEDLLTYTTSDGGKTWSALRIPKPDLSSGGAGVDVSLLQSVVSGESSAQVEPQTEMIEGKTCYVLDAVFTGDAAKEAMASTMSILNQAGMPSDFSLGLEEDWSSLSSPVRMWIDAETFLPVRVYQDIGELTEAILSSTINSLLSEYSGSIGSTGSAEENADIPQIDIKVNKYDITSTTLEYNGITSIEIPQEARDSLNESSGSSDASDTSDTSDDASDTSDDASDTSDEGGSAN